MIERAGRRRRPHTAAAAARGGRYARVRVASVASALAVGALVPAASAGAATTQEFSLGPSSNPNDIVSGPGGTLWVTVDGGFARVTPGSGAVTRVTAGLSPGSQPWALATGTAGSLWFTTNDEETGDGNGVVGRITAAATVQERPDESLDQPPALRDVAGRPDGTAVFVGNADAGLGIFSETDDGPLYDFTDFDTGANPSPTSVALAPDGSAWTTGTDDPSTITKATFAPRRDDYAATYTEFPVPPGDGFYDAGAAEDIVAGPDGGMWFTLPSVSAVGRIDVATGAVSIVKTAAGSAPTGIALGPDRAIWFTDAGPVPGIGRIDPITRAVVERTDGFSSAEARPRRITTGPDGAMWFTMPGSNAVGRVDPATFAAAPPTTDPPVPAPDPPAPTPDPPVNPAGPPPPALPVPTPVAPTPAPAPAPVTPAPAVPVVRALRFDRVSRGVRVRSPRRARLRFNLNRAATVRVSVSGAAARSRVLAADRTIRGRAGVNRLMLPRLAPGLHVVTLRAATLDGRRATVRVRVRVLAARKAAPAFTG